MGGPSSARPLLVVGINVLLAHNRRHTSRRRRRGTRRPDESKALKKHEQRLEAEKDGQRNHGADDACDGQ